MFEEVEEVMLEEEVMDTLEEEAKPETPNNRQRENEIISKAIEKLTKGSFQERKPYLKDLHGNGVYIDGLYFQKDGLCWNIWKPTDVGCQYNGERLLKIVPTSVKIEDIPTVLDVQPWIYL